MDTRTLKQFVTLADTLHFGRASNACHVSASALSRSIRQLETEVGATLFERNNRSVALTREGRVLLDFARDSLTQWDVVRNQLMEEAGVLRGEVSMYCSVTASYSFLFELLSEFRRAHPRIEIKLHTGDPEAAVRRVLSGEEDISIGARPNRLPSGLAFKSIAKTPLVFIAAADHTDLAGLSGGKANPQRWARTPMILSETGLARRRVDGWFRALGVQPEIYAQVAGNEAIVSMVSLGFGVGVVPKIVLDNSPLVGQVNILKIHPRLEAYDVGLFAQENKLKSPLIEAFWTGTG